MPVGSFHVIKVLPFQFYLSIAVVCDGPAGDAFKMGTVHEGVVRNIQPFGALIGFNGVTGLLHSSEISHSPVDAVDAIFKIRDKVWLPPHCSRNRWSHSIGLTWGLLLLVSRLLFIQKG